MSILSFYISIFTKGALSLADIRKTFKRDQSFEILKYLFSGSLENLFNKSVFFSKFYHLLHPPKPYIQKLCWT